VSCNGQFRRFLFNGTEFTSLRSQVSQILGLESEFVLKYKDNEGDLITISSDEELVCALSYSDGSVLRLVVDQGMNIDQGTNTVDISCRHTNSMESRCRGGRWNRRGHNFHCQEGRGVDKKSRLTLKRDLLKSKLESIPKDIPLSPDQLNRQKMLEIKLNRINGCLERLNNVVCNKEEWMKNREGWKKCREDWRKNKWNHDWKSNKDEWKSNKNEWKSNKDEWKLKKKERKEMKKTLEGKKNDENLSPAAKEEISLLKVQINSVKPEICEIKKQVRAKNQALKEGNGDPGTLWKEIYELKMKVVEKRSLIYPHKLRIRELRNSSAC